MLALTQNAVEVVRSIVSADEAPEGAGLRIATAEGTEAQDGLELSISAGPAQNDQVLNGDGAVIFLAEQVTGYLDDKVLDADVDDQGEASFALALQSDLAEQDGQPQDTPPREA